MSLVSVPYAELTKDSISKFVIASKLNGRVVDVEGGNKLEGTKIIMYDQSLEYAANQLWYVGKDGFIKSYLNDMTFYAPSEGETLRMSKINDPRAKWRIDGDKIRNDSGQYLDIIGAINSNGAELCAYSWNGCDNQRWIIKYK